MYENIITVIKCRINWPNVVSMDTSFFFKVKTRFGRAFTNRSTKNTHYKFYTIFITLNESFYSLKKKSTVKGYCLKTFIHMETFGSSSCSISTIFVYFSIKKNFIFKMTSYTVISRTFFNHTLEQISILNKERSVNYPSNVKKTNIFQRLSASIDFLTLNGHQLFTVSLNR